MARAFPTLPKGETVASFETYAEAQSAVDTLAKADVPREGARDRRHRPDERRAHHRQAHLGPGGRRRARCRAPGSARSSACCSSSSRPPARRSASCVSAVLIGAGFGMIFSVVSYSVNRRRRDFTSVMQVLATRYAIIAEAAHVDRARTVLGRRRAHRRHGRPSRRTPTVRGVLASDELRRGARMPRAAPPRHPPRHPRPCVPATARWRPPRPRKRRRGMPRHPPTGLPTTTPRRRRRNADRRRLPADRLLGHVKSHTSKKSVEVLARDLLGERDEVRGRGGAAAEALDPRLRQLEERLVADLRRAGRAGSRHRGRRSGSGTDRADRGRRRRDPTPRRRRGSTGSRRTTPGRMSRSRCSFHIHVEYVAQPSLSQMSAQRTGLTWSPIHWCASSWATVPSRRGPGEERPRLGLERVADRVVVDDRPVRVERVRPVQPLEEDEHVARQCKVR